MSDEVTRNNLSVKLLDLRLVVESHGHYIRCSCISPCQTISNLLYWNVVKNNLGDCNLSIICWTSWKVQLRKITTTWWSTYRPICSKSEKLNIEHIYTTGTQTSPYEEAISWICFLQLFNTKYRSFSPEKRFRSKKFQNSESCVFFRNSTDLETKPCGCSVLGRSDKNYETEFHSISNVKT